MKRLSMALLLPAVGLACVALVACAGGTPVPLPAQTAASNSALAGLERRPILFARDEDLWWAHLDGTGEEQLSQGGALRWRSAVEWSWAAQYNSVQVSPDGRWVAWSDGWDLVVVDVASRLQASTDEPDRVVYLDWAPDSHAVAYATVSGSGSQDNDIYLYDPDHKTAEHLLSLKGEAAGIKHLLWSPDSRAIAFSCCSKRLQTADGEKDIATVRELNVASRRVEAAGEMEVYVASSSWLCWTAAGEIIASPQHPAPGQAVRCCRCPRGIGGVSIPGVWTPGVSPDGLRRLQLSPLDTSGSAGMVTWLAVRAADAGTATAPLWERKLQGVALSRGLWSPDGQYLLLDDNEPHSPIWRLRADGTGELEKIVEDGFLVDAVPAWQ